MGWIALSSFPGHGAEVTVDGLSLPFFNEAGALTHKLVAKHGVATGETKQLEEAEILYFAADDPTHVIQRVAAATAVWNEKAGTLTGGGLVEVRTETSQLSGEGFDFTLATSVLHIQRTFRMANPDFVLTGDRATADLLIDKRGEQLKLRDVRRCEAEGDLHLVASSGHPSKLPFQEAFTDLGIYEGMAHTITLPHPIRFIDGTRHGVTHSALIHLTNSIHPK